MKSPRDNTGQINTMMKLIDELNDKGRLLGKVKFPEFSEEIYQ